MSADPPVAEERRSRVPRPAEATDVEVAAVAVALALGSAGPAPEPPAKTSAETSAWTDRAAAVRAPLRPGRDAWRRSLGWPR